MFVHKEAKRNRFESLIKAYFSYSIIGLFLNSLMLVLWIDIVGMGEYYAPIVNLLVTVPLNFMLNKYWAFK